MAWPHLETARPSDGERDRAIALLREGAGAGRLSHDTFVRRMSFVLSARSRAELAQAVRDLPGAEAQILRDLRDSEAQLVRDLPGAGARSLRDLPAAGARSLPEQARPAGWGTRTRPKAVAGDVVRRLRELTGLLSRLADRMPRVVWPTTRPTAPRTRPPLEAGRLEIPGLELPPPGSPTVRIGRDLDATLRMADPSVSRRHAELRHVGDGWMVRDLASMNGTYLNGLRITGPVRVRAGDHLRFGAVSYVLTWTDQH